MQASVEQEQHKISRVPLAYARAHPRAMVIVDFDAEATYTAMERTWWSQYLTCIAVGELLIVRSHLFGQDASVVLVHCIDFLLCQQFESIRAEERLDCCNTCPCTPLFLVIVHDLFGSFVGDTVLLVVVDLLGP